MHIGRTWLRDFADGSIVRQMVLCWLQKDGYGRRTHDTPSTKTIFIGFWLARLTSFPVGLALKGKHEGARDLAP